MLQRMHLRPARPFHRSRAPRGVRLLLGLMLAATAAISLVAAPSSSRAQDAADPAPEVLDKKRMKELEALIERFALAAENDEPDGAMMLVENDAEKLPPIPASAVAPLLDHLLALRMKHGPKLKKAGSDYFYDEKTKKGLYMVARGKKGGGLLIAMHGGGEGSGDAGSAFGVWSAATKAGFTVVAPEVMKKVSSAWNEQPEEQMVLQMIDAAKRTFELDPDRICLAGHSMGGDASWMLGGRNADLLAACAPLAGSVMPYMRVGTKNRLETPLSDYEGLMEGVIPNLMHVRYHIHHSDDDRNEAIHPDDIATGYLRRLQKLFGDRYETRYQFRYDRVSGNGHALPRPRKGRGDDPGILGVPDIIKWLGAQRRVSYPKEIVWETWWPWKRQMYWLFHHEPKSAWRFHAKVVGKNHLDVTATTKPAPGRTEPKEIDLRLLLSPEMVDFERPLKVTSGDAVLYEGKIERSVWALLVTAGRRMDRKMYFEGHLDVRVPRKMWWDLWESEK